MTLPMLVHQGRVDASATIDAMRVDEAA